MVTRTSLVQNLLTVCFIRSGSGTTFSGLDKTEAAGSIK